jgi:cyclic pyranopterin phosphate synthase
MSSAFSHVDSSNAPTMVDVGDKTVTARSVFHTAIIAGTMAAKRTHELIPFCHPLGIEKCNLDIVMHGDEAVVTCTVSVHHKTGVEMEALTGASIAALTIYDMCKALSHEIIIADTRLLRKYGGKSDFQQP